MTEPLEFRVPDYGYGGTGKHRAATPWRWALWALGIQWFLIFGLVVLLIWGA